jgi:Uma2 family endonuclease
MTAMLARSTDAPVPLGEHVPNANQRIEMYDVSWQGFETLLALRGERRWPRLAYLDGTVELMGASQQHERIKSMIGRLIEAYCLDRDIYMMPYGSWLQKRKTKKAGVEPDECYIFDAQPQRKNKPDLAIEVVWTSGGIDKLEIYKRLQIAEVWYWENDSLVVYVLGPAGYAKRKASVCVPGLDLELVCKLVACTTVNEAVKKLRAALGRG